jgi:hypothetical protein
LLLLATIGGHQTNANLLPQDLVGFWTTDEPRYQGRFLELYRVYVILGNGSEQGPQVETVDSVEVKPDREYIAYTISSSDLAGTRDKMTLLYTPKNGGEIRFSHQENRVWRRHKESPAPPPAAEPKAPSPAVRVSPTSKAK